MKIKWKGKLSKTNTFPSPKIPSNALPFLESTSKLGNYAAIVPIVVFVFACFYIKSNFIAVVKLNLLGDIIGLLLTFPFMIIHELLHTVCFPPNTTVEIFYSASGLSVFPNTPISKSRYIFALSLPALILGIVPLLMWVFIHVTNVTLNSIWFITSIGNLGGTTVDFYNMVHAIKEMPRDSVLQLSGLKCYYYKIE